MKLSGKRIEDNANFSSLLLKKKEWEAICIIFGEFLFWIFNTDASSSIKSSPSILFEINLPSSLVPGKEIQIFKLCSKDLVWASNSFSFFMIFVFEELSFRLKLGLATTRDLLLLKIFAFY